MYGGDPKFIADVRGICGTLVEEILNHLKNLNTPEVSFCLLSTNYIKKNKDTVIK
jgi:hypothetical protein